MDKSNKIDKTELNKEYIKSKIQNILNKVHKNDAKLKIVSRNDCFNFACPVCGDSQKYNGAHKKRGNFYFRNAMFKCFNCDETMSFTKLCETFNENVDIDEKIKLYKYIDENVSFTNVNNDYIMEEMDRLIDLDDFMDFFNNRKNSWLYDIKPVESNSHVGQYLKYDRYIINPKQILQGIYRIVKEGKTVFETKVMISLNMSLATNKIIGIQLRNLEKSKEKRFYKIVEFEELYNYMNPGKILDDMEAISYNKLSHYYNILNINFDKLITVFEGFIDSHFYPNSIGMVGASNDNDLLNFLLNSDIDIQLQFFYDNDATGILKATKMLKGGHNVFLWNKLFDKLTEKNREYNAKKKLYGIIDLNDLVVSAKNPNVYKTLKLDKFFSIDDFDLMYLDKVLYNKDDKTFTVKR